MPPTTEEKATLISQYPRQHEHVGRSFALSIFLHLLLAALVCLVTYWLGVTTLKDLLTKGGSIAETGPAPEPPITVELVEEETPPPPTPNPQFIREIIQPTIVPPVPPPRKPEVKPDIRPKPKYTAPNAHGSGQSQNVSAAKIGTSGLPHPSYPYEVLARREGGTVGMEVVFGPDGSVISADVKESSGVPILDVSTRNFIFSHWKNAGLANSTIHIPIIYDPNQRSAGGGQ